MVDAKSDVLAIFSEALAQSTDEDRSNFLDKACGDDTALRGRLDDLLRAHQDAGHFLSGSASATVAHDAPLTERPGTQIGPYKLLQQIGEGGMGVVWMAEQTQPVQRKVALKVIKPGMGSRQVITRFEAERQALAMMDHVNIARVLDAGTTESGLPYFVMELVHGVPITKYCDDNHLTPRERLELFVPVCQAIQHAHQKGIIHRDIKPSNVMITLYDGKPAAKVIDFGVAKATEQTLTERTLFTQYGTMVGTLEYMSPEQAEMSALGVDTRSDIFSLGVLLYELLTGSTPLTHKRLKEAAYSEVLRLIKEEEPPKPSTRLSESGEAMTSISAQRHMEPAKLTKLVRGELDWIVMKTLEKDRNRRYETASAFAADVQRYLNNEAVQACPLSGWYRFRKFARRNKPRLAIAGMILFFLVLLVGGGGWVMRDRAARQREADSKALEVLEVVEPRLREGQAGDPAVVAAAQRVKALLDGSSLGPEVRRRAQHAWRDSQMLAELDEIRLRQADSKDGEMFDSAGAERRYAAAFAAYSLDVAVLEPSQAAARVRESAVREALLVGLDAWIQIKPAQDPDRARLWAVADEADDSTWRRAFRSAALAGDTKQLQALAEPGEAVAQRPAVLAWLGSVLDAAGLRNEAEFILRQAQQRYPGDFWMNYNLGHFLVLGPEPQRPEEAVGYFRAAVAVRPASAEARSILGLSLELKGDTDAAIAAYRQAIALSPEFLVARCNLGSALRQKGQLDEAIACYRKALELDPKSAGAHVNLGCALSEQGKLEEAVACYRKALELDPKFAMAHNDLGFVLGRQEKLEEAVACLRKALELDPKNALAHSNLARIIVTYPDRKLGNAAEAVQLARKAVELAPAKSTCWRALGAAHYRAGSWKEAVVALEKSLAVSNGGDGFAWFLLAMAHWQLGEKEKARTWFDRAAQWTDKNQPKDEEFRRFRAEAAELMKIDPKKP
jgi:serine/threonine protein kinase/tetratricopeptide (TPR) repeat protein